MKTQTLMPVLDWTSLCSQGASMDLVLHLQNFPVSKVSFEDRTFTFCLKLVHLYSPPQTGATMKMISAQNLGPGWWHIYCMCLQTLTLVFLLVLLFPLHVLSSPEHLKGCVDVSKAPRARTELTTAVTTHKEDEDEKSWGLNLNRHHSSRIFSALSEIPLSTEYDAGDFLRSERLLFLQ